MYQQAREACHKVTHYVYDGHEPEREVNWRDKDFYVYQSRAIQRNNSLSHATNFGYRHAYGSATTRTHSSGCERLRTGSATMDRTIDSTGLSDVT
jgi:hypothetical protein